MAIRFTSEFRSDTGIDYKIEIDDSVFVGSPTTFVVGSEGFTLQYSGETDDIISPIMSSNVSIPFMVQNALQQTFFEQLVAVQESRFRVKISRYDSGSYKTYWVGYVMQDIAQIEDAPFPYIYELRAVDGLGRLANIDYNINNDIFQNSLALTRLNKLIYNCLAAIGTTDLFASGEPFLETCVNWWENNMVYSTTKDAANEIAVDRRIWTSINDEGVETYTKMIDVLRQLCVTFGARVYQSNGRFIFEQYSERAAASRVVSTYNRSGSYVATTAKSDDVVIDQTVGKARLAGNQFDFLPAIKRCEIEFQQKFMGSRVGQINFTHNRTAPYVFGFISADANAVLEINCPSVRFYITNQSPPPPSVPFSAITPIFGLMIRIEDVNNPGTYWYYSRAFNGYNTPTPYGPASWTTTASDYMFDPGNSQFNFNGNMAIFSSINIQTDQLPVSGELVFQLKQPVLRYVFNNGLYSSPPLYSGLPVDSFITYLYSANVDYVSDGALNSESVIYRASNGNTGIESNLVLSLGTTSVADGPLQTGNLAVYTGSIWAGSDQWRKGNSGAYKKILQLLVTEALALHAKPIRRYNGSFYSSHDISRRFTFDTFDWLFIGGSLSANNENVDGEFFAIARDVSQVVDLNNDFVQGDLLPMSANKYNGPNSFGGVFNDGSIAGMLVDSENHTVGPFSQPNPGEARITGTTTVDGDAFFTQDIDITGDLTVDGTIVIDGLGDVATESWVIAQGYLTAESDTLDSVTDRGNVTTNTINVGGVTSDYVLFDTTATPTPSLGMAYWNTDEGTVSLQVNGVSYELGQKEAWIVKNQSGATITKGTVVMAVGALGASARILAGKMVADGSVSPRFLLGVAAENIANGADGRVIHRGKLRQFNTSAFAVGDVLYCDPTTPGGLTNVEPQAPNLKLAVAFVLSSGTNGALAIRINAGNRLSEDHDVQLSTLSTGQLLRYNSNRWENWTPNFLTPSNVSGTTNYVSKFTGTNTVGNSQIFDNGTNVGIGTATPSTKLEIANSTSVAGIKITTTSGNETWFEAINGAGQYGRFGVATSGHAFFNTDSSGYRFLTNAGGDVVRITAAGDVGIGTTSPSGKLNIAGVTAFNSGLNIDGNTANGVGMSLRNAGGNDWYIISTGSSNGGGANNLGFYNDNVGEYRLYVTSGGNVGIGTTSPSYKLDVSGSIRATADSIANRFYTPGFVVPSSAVGVFNNANYSGPGWNNAAFVTGNGATGVMMGGDAASYTYGWIQGVQTDNGTAKNLAIQPSGGLVGINTTTPAARLDVNGDLRTYTGITSRGEHTNTFIENILPAANNGAGTGDVQLRMWSSEPGVTWDWAGFGYNVRNDNGSPAGFGRVNTSFGQAYMRFATTGDWYFYNTNTSGTRTTTMTLTGNGNVGIGTTSPSRPLDVNGAIRTQTSTIDFGNSTNTQIWGDGTNLNFKTNGSEKMIVTSGGNVGIGTTNPLNKLVVSNGGANGVEINPDYLGQSYIVAYDRNAGQYKTINIEANEIQFRTGSSAIIRGIITSAGNVGIGTTSPATRLHVDASGHAMVVSNDTGNRRIYFGTGGTGEPDIQATLSNGTARQLSINAAGGNVGIGTTSPLQLLHVAGLAYFGSDIFCSVNNGIFFSGNNSYNAGIYGRNSGSDLVLQSGGSERMRIVSSGNVGIGTTSPGSKLDITSTNGDHLRLSFNSSYYWELGREAADGRLSFTDSQNGEVVTIQPSGNVGIGTTAPVYKFEVSDGTRTGVFNPNAALDGFFIGTYQAKPLILGTADTERMRITSGGNVGIGTTSPGQKLSVEGGSIQLNANNAASNYYLILNKKSGQDGGVLFNRDNSGDWQLSNNASSGDLIFYSYGTSSEAITFKKASGNVGIGTTSPSAKLHVANGNILTQGSSGGGVFNSLYVTTTASTARNWTIGASLYAFGDFVINQSNAKDGDPISAGTNRFYISSAGDVGIGTTSPSAKLHVIGNATVSATLSTANAKISGTLADSFNQVGTAGQILSSTGTGIEWITGGGGGGGSTIAVKDEGVSIGSSFTTLDFQGNNIQATASGSTAVITAFNNAGTGSMYVDAVTTNYAPGATFADVEIDSSIIFAASPDAASGSSKLIATVTFGVENVSSFDEFNSFEFRLYDVSQSIVVSNTTHTWTGYMSKNEGATTTVFTFHIPLDIDVAPGDEIRVQAKQGASITPEIYYCAITLMEGTV